MNSGNPTSTRPRSPESVIRDYIERLARHDPSAFDLIAEDFVQHAAGP